MRQYSQLNDWGLKNWDKQGYLLLVRERVQFIAERDGRRVPAAYLSDLHFCCAGGEGGGDPGHFGRLVCGPGRWKAAVSEQPLDVCRGLGVTEHFLSDGEETAGFTAQLKADAGSVAGGGSHAQSKAGEVELGDPDWAEGRVGGGQA